MKIKQLAILIALIATFSQVVNAQNLTLKQQLGKNIFFDKNLSSPAGQSCESCHNLEKSLSDPVKNSPVSLGAVSGRSGTRNAPSATYAKFSPIFHFDKKEGIFIGGQFLDGRAANLAEQAKEPFLNTDEMNNKDAASVIKKIRQAKYAKLFKKVFGENALDDPKTAFDNVAKSLVAFQNADIFKRFTSKFDYYLRGMTTLSKIEQRGLELFEDEKKGNCAACHPSKIENGEHPLFTDFSYDNLGTPKNPMILKLKGDDFIDLGLGKFKGSSENGKFKVQTLRNIAKTAPYMHNGVFSDLKEVTDFYNTRDVDKKWAAPEVVENLNKDELGDLKLTDDEVDAIVAFMETLTDGWQVK